MYRKKIKENDTHASLIYVVAMEMQMSHTGKHDNSTNEYFQVNVVPIDQSIKKLKDSFKDPTPPPPS